MYRADSKQFRRLFYEIFGKLALTRWIAASYPKELEGVVGLKWYSTANIHLTPDYLAKCAGDATVAKTVAGKKVMLLLSRDCFD